MRIIRSFVPVVYAAFAAGSLVACSGGSSGPPGVASGVNLDATARSVPQLDSSSHAVSTAPEAQSLGDATTSRIFVSDAADNAIDAFDAKGHELYQITGFSEPQGIATDTSGKLYVADTANSRIQIFANPDGGTPLTIADPGEYPAGVAVSAKLVAATNILSTSGGPGSVTFYAQGATTPCATVANANLFARVYFGAFDANDDLFVDGEDMQGNATVGEVTGGCAAKTIAPLTLGGGASLGFPGAVGVNTHDQIALSGENGIYTFAQPVRGSLGKPLHTTHLTGESVPASFVFAADGRHVWSANSHIAEYLYPTGGLPIVHFKNNSARSIAIAVLPAETP